MLKIYNSLKREKQSFVPIEPGAVRMYVCGMTVYDYCHLGHARVMVVFDLVYRWLKASGLAVTYVRNITDIDDKIIKRAAENGESIQALTDRFIACMHEDAAALGVLPPTHEPRATEFVQPRADGKVDMITLIERLIARGHAYEANGEVLFDTHSMADYGDLSKRNLDEQQAGARVAVDAHKKNPGDFVLWKLSSPEEPGWDSPWGRGRPGWHIECSAMSAAYLGEVFDIHGGGLDLIFPHHENEIAQSRCAHGTKVMSNVWMHNGFLQVEGRKMSKSEGNFYTITELLHEEKFGGRKWPGEVLRLAMLMTHYREPIDFSVKRLEEAERLLSKWPAGGDPAEGRVDQTVLTPLFDDLNTVGAVQALHALAQCANSDPLMLPVFAASARLLGVLPKKAEVSKALEESIDTIIQLRLEMLKAKNFAEADRIRDDLSAKGVQLKDGKDPATGERVTTWEVKR